MRTFILLFQSRDREGIVARISDFIFKNGGNIIALDQYSTDPEGGRFFMRAEFTVKNKDCDKAAISAKFTAIGKSSGAEWRVFDKSEKLSVGILASRPDHCLADLLYLWRARDLPVEIPLVISNHKGHRGLVESYGVPFYFVASSAKDREEAEILSYVNGRTDFLALARYMLILSKRFLKSYGRDIINIHHGFLPSFKGRDPYAQALGKGVKIIGATAHFVNEKLDEGPIITQAVEEISHRDDLASLVRKGRNLEKRALSDAVTSYADYRVIRHGNKTVVF